MSTTEEDARALDQAIDETIGDLLDLFVEAFSTGAWVTLGYSSWTDYLDTKRQSRLQVAVEARQATFERLREAGMSDRQIAATTGLSQSTVSRSSSDANASDDDHDSGEEDGDGDQEPEFRVFERRLTPDRPGDWPKPEDWAELHESRFTRNVRRIFGAIAKAEVRFSVDRIAEVAQSNGEFEALLREDIAESRRWFDQIDAALAARPTNIRTIRRVQ